MEYLLGEMLHCSPGRALTNPKGITVMLGAALREISIAFIQPLLTFTVKDFHCPAGTIGDGE